MFLLPWGGTTGCAVTSTGAVTYRCAASQAVTVSISTIDPITYGYIRNSVSVIMYLFLSPRLKQEAEGAVSLLGAQCPRRLSRLVLSFCGHRCGGFACSPAPTSHLSLLFIPSVSWLCWQITVLALGLAACGVPGRRAAPHQSCASLPALLSVFY